VPGRVSQHNYTEREREREFKREKWLFKEREREREFSKRKSKNWRNFVQQKCQLRFRVAGLIFQREKTERERERVFAITFHIIVRLHSGWHFPFMKFRDYHIFIIIIIVILRDFRDIRFLFVRFCSLLLSRMFDIQERRLFLREREREEE